MTQGLSLVLFGATGLVGGEVLRLAAAEPRIAKLVALTRRPLALPTVTQNGPRIDARVVDFRRPKEWRALLRVDAIVCALGTTIKAAGSRERFREVDYDLPLGIANLGCEENVQHFLLVSALGADPRSSIFYIRTKGLLEEAVRALGYPRLTLVRPSLLLGERREFRFGEELTKRLSFLFPARYKPVSATDVAAALLVCALAPGSGMRVVDSVEIASLARTPRN